MTRDGAYYRRVESKPAFVGAIVQRRRALQTLLGAHRGVLYFCC